MSKIRSKNTAPEILVFKELRKRKIYFFKHYSKIPGKPDIALPRKKIAVFIDGDFWHGYGFSKQKKRLPKNTGRRKFRAILKETAGLGASLKDGWRILRVWSHELKKPQGVLKIVTF